MRPIFRALAIVGSCRTGKVALLVAGYSAQDTTGATTVVANFDDPAYEGKFTGMELEVTETSSSTPTIGPPTVMEAAEGEAEAEAEAEGE